MLCPNCNNELLSENINVNTDLGKCHLCNHVFKLSDHIGNIMDDGFDINDPPKDTWIIRDRDVLIIGASTRSAIAFFLVPFMLIWSGGSIGGIYGTQITDGEFDLSLSLFGIPFLLGSIVFWALTLMSIWGKVELTFHRGGGEILTGIGNLGYRKRFSWDEVSEVHESVRPVNRKGNGGSIIQLEGKKRISFGHGLQESRKYYIYRAVKETLQKVKDHNGNFSPF